MSIARFSQNVWSGKDFSWSVTEKRGMLGAGGRVCGSLSLLRVCSRRQFSGLLEQTLRTVTTGEPGP